MVELITPEEFRADRLKAMNDAATSSTSEPNVNNDSSSLSISVENFLNDRIKARAAAAADNIRFDDNVVDFGENEPEASTYNIDFDATRKKADLKKVLKQSYCETT